MCCWRHGCSRRQVVARRHRGSGRREHRRGHGCGHPFGQPSPGRHEGRHEHRRLRQVGCSRPRNPRCACQEQEGHRRGGHDGGHAPSDPRPRPLKHHAITGQSLVQARPEIGRRLDHWKHLQGQQRATHPHVERRTGRARIPVCTHRQRLLIAEKAIDEFRVQPAELAAGKQRAARHRPSIPAAPHRVPPLPSTVYNTAGRTMSANADRARFSRDFTVPRLQCVISAISSYERPSSSRSTKTCR